MEDILLTASQEVAKSESDKALEPLVEQIMVVGQDRPWLGAFVVVNPSQLEARGYLSREEAEEIRDAIGKIQIGLGHDVDQARAKLQQYSQLLNENELLKKSIEKEWNEVFMEQYLRMI